MVTCDRPGCLCGGTVHGRAADVQLSRARVCEICHGTGFRSKDDPCDRCSGTGVMDKHAKAPRTGHNRKREKVDQRGLIAIAESDVSRSA